MPEELWTEVHEIVQEAVIKTISKKKAKWLCEKALQIAEKKEATGKGEKQRCTHLNVEFRRITRIDKKAFLSDQCKEIKENNRMGKTRDLFKKTRDSKGIFHAKMDTIKDRKKQKILRRGGKKTQKYTKKILMTLHSDTIDAGPQITSIWVHTVVPGAQEDPEECGLSLGVPKSWGRLLFLLLKLKMIC